MMNIELESMKKEVKHVVTTVAKVAKNLENDISSQVARATKHLRSQTTEAGVNVEAILVDAH